MEPIETLIDTHEAARILSMSYQHTARLARNGVLPSVRIGQTYRFKPSLVRAYLEEEQRLITAADLARMLNVTPSKIIRSIRNGILWPHVIRGCRYYFDREHIQAWIDNGGTIHQVPELPPIC